MAQPRIVNHESMYVKSLPLHADAILTATLIKFGDLVRYESAGVGLFDTATEEEKFLGVAMGTTLTTMVAATDYIPVAMKCIVEIDLSSANYDFGDQLGYAATANTLCARATTTTPTIAWFWGRDEDSITRGLVLIDATNALTTGLFGRTAIGS
jgi:hypothetical protein